MSAETLKPPYEATSRVELLVKADQLDKPNSLAARGLMGLGSLLVDAPNPEIPEMIAEGKAFLEIVERDQKCQERLNSSSGTELTVFLIDDKDRLYWPSEVLPTGINIEQTIANIKPVLDRLADPSARNQVGKDEIRKIFKSLRELSREYMQCEGRTLGEIKYGPALRIKDLEKK